MRCTWTGRINLFFCIFFAIPSSSRHEKRCQMVKRHLVVFHHSRNIPYWIFSENIFYLFSKSARASPESPPSANDKFTSIEKVNTEPPAPSNGLKKKLWSSNNSSSRYKERYAEINSGSPRVQWSYNIQKDSPNANLMKRSISYQD